jgi:hypothetical protein
VDLLQVEAAAVAEEVGIALSAEQSTVPQWQKLDSGQSSTSMGSTSITGR